MSLLSINSYKLLSPNGNGPGDNGSGGHEVHDMPTTNVEGRGRGFKDFGVREGNGGERRSAGAKSGSAPDKPGRALSHRQW